MKVAALEERRDRIMKNRRFAKSRKKAPVAVAATSTAAQSDSGVFVDMQAAVPSGNESHELKIKTVFQRHKQEQEGATRKVCFGWAEARCRHLSPCLLPLESNTVSVRIAK